MVCTSYKTIFAMLATLSVASAGSDGSPAASGQVGVCYAAWHHETVTKEILLSDVQQIGQYFSGFRTFETRMSGVNIIDVAASAGVKVAVGVQMNDLNAVDAEIQAVCEGYARNPGAVETVWVGNENLKNGDFGTVSADQLIGFIDRVKECTKGGVPVGTVQRINEWLEAADAKKVADSCQKLGTNIYPFFTNGQTTAVQKLQSQWEKMTGTYDADKCVLTETGWPSSGGDYEGNVASLEGMQQYLDDFVTWSQDKSHSYWFMMFDTTKSYTQMEFEKNFGVFTATGELKVKIPGAFKAKTGISLNATEPLTGPGVLPGNDSEDHAKPDQNGPLQELPQHETPEQGPPGATPVVQSGEGATEAPRFAVGEPLYFNADGSPAPPPAPHSGEPAPGTEDDATVDVEQSHPLDPHPGATPVVQSGEGATEAPRFALGEPLYFNADGSPAPPPAPHSGEPASGTEDDATVDVEQSHPLDPPAGNLPVVESGKDCAM